MRRRTNSQSEMREKGRKVSTESRTRMKMLKGIEYNSSKKGKCVMTTESTEDCESENKNTEVENDKKVSFNNVTNVG